MTTIFAQTTTVPNNGASNAEDFQPQTQNPQQVPSNVQQQSGGVQSTGGQEVLGDSTAEIIVPQGNGQSFTPVRTAEPGTNWFGVGMVVVALMLIVWYAHKHWRRRRQTPVQHLEATPEPTIDTVEPEPEEPSAPEPKSEPKPKPAPAASASKSSKKKKSKSKRKKSRK